MSRFIRIKRRSPLMPFDAKRPEPTHTFLNINDIAKVDFFKDRTEAIVLYMNGATFGLSGKIVQDLEQQLSRLSFDEIEDIGGMNEHKEKS